MSSVRMTILRLFNIVDPEGVFDLTGMPDEYLSEVDDLLSVTRTNPPRDAKETIAQVHWVMVDNFRSDCPTIVLLDASTVVEGLVVKRRSIGRTRKRMLSPTPRERRLGQMIWEALQEIEGSLSGEGSTEEESRKSDHPRATHKGSSDPHD